MKKLHQIVNKLKVHTDAFEKKNDLVSNSTVGWQIAHSLKTIEQIVRAIINSEPKNYTWTFNFNRILILYVLKSIPRGKAKAPKIVLPEPLLTSEMLLNSFENVASLLKNWDQLDNHAYFAHPFFGLLNKKETERFLIVHTYHHLKIIKDICSN